MVAVTLFKIIAIFVITSYIVDAEITGLAFGSAEACIAEQNQINGPWNLRDCTGNTINIMWARMWNSTHGYAYSTDITQPSQGISFRQTMDSGHNWKIVYTLKPFESYTDLDWNSWDIVTATGYMQQGDNTIPLILRSNNGGETWKYSTILHYNHSSDLSTHVMAVAWYDNNKAIAGGYTFNRIENKIDGALFSTIDAGENWSYQELSSEFNVKFIDHVHPVTTTSLWFGGQDQNGTAAIWRTEDEGKSLIRETIINEGLYQGSSAYQVNMKNNGTNAIAGRAIVGDHNAILRYIPSNYTWIQDYSPYELDEQVFMCYNSKDGSMAVATGSINSLGQPFIKQWDIVSSQWYITYVNGTMSTPQQFKSIYLYY